MDDAFELRRFTVAQDPVWNEVLVELAAGAKRSHWMWFVFPQRAGLGRSAMAQRYALSSLEEARAYLAHPVLGPRLRTCCALLQALPARRTALEVFGPVDAAKLRSSLSLFAAAAPGEPLFADLMARFFDGRPDPAALPS